MFPYMSYSSWDESLGMKERIELETGGRGVVPPVSVKDRAVVGPADHV